MRLGHFSEFKSFPSVILLSTLEPDDFRQLHDAISSVATGDSISINTLSGVHVCGEISLNVALCESESLVSVSGVAFTWQLDLDAMLNVLDKIQPLTLNRQAGHQYFEYPDHTVIMSLGEYSDAWWQRSGG